MLSTTIQILLYFGVALFLIVLSVISFTVIGYAIKMYYKYSNKGRLPTPVTHSGDPGAHAELSVAT
jgi:hypothetical protein